MSKVPSNLYILRLSFAHFATGMLFLLIAMLGAVWFLPDLVRLGTFRITEGWLLAHLLLLGFASLTAIGASYQLVQVILRTALFSRALGWVQYASYVSGLLLILLGFGLNLKLVAPGGILTVVGITLYAVNIGMTLINKREWSPFVLGIMLSVAAFLLAGIMGTLLGLHLAGRAEALEYEALFGSHLWLGIGGWLSGIILIFSFKLIPMFYVSPKKVTRQVYAIVGGFHMGIYLHTASLWSGIDALALCAYGVIAISGVWFSIYLFQVKAASRAKAPIGAVRVAFYLIPVHIGLFLIWGLLDLQGGAEAVLLESMIVLLILGWFIPSIFSYLSKILPFLWWAHRFRSKEEKKSAVLLSQMLPERRLTMELVGYLAGTAVMAHGFYWNLPLIAVIGQVVMALFLLVYLVELMRVFKY
jgi:hypothetical protein